MWRHHNQWVTLGTAVSVSWSPGTELMLLEIRVQQKSQFPPKLFDISSFNQIFLYILSRHVNLSDAVGPIRADGTVRVNSGFRTN
ncbi:hypothetical protein RRG08_019745 [Elysia crispata]|uniref:Uncharacterized protein n=1 Tax=Elysia crispata TaxID=231223 RepID=A0AAE0Y841_9GAST|nr:hypothetical protein RRG08_019745 [Elysia crispata]